MCLELLGLVLACTYMILLAGGYLYMILLALTNVTEVSVFPTCQRCFRDRLRCPSESSAESRNMVLGWKRHRTFWN